MPNAAPIAMYIQKAAVEKKNVGGTMMVMAFSSNLSGVSCSETFTLSVYVPDGRLA